MRCLPIVGMALVALSAGSARAGDVSFAAKPSAAKQGDRVKLAFTVSAPTDVEVAVLGADGKIVCHLAAGVLGGKNPPPAPLVAGLAQNLEWDGRDDFGKPAGGAPFKFRVRAGMRPAFDGFVGASPYILDTVRGMVVDGQGNLFVLNQSIDGHGGWPFDLRVYDRKGNYLRSLMPFRAGMKKEEAEVFKAVDAGGQMIPRNFQSTWPHLYPTDATLRLAGVTPDGALVLYDDQLRFVYRLRSADGGPAGRVFEEPLWPGKGPRLIGSAAVAMAADGKALFAAGVGAAPPKGQRVSADWPDGCILKLAIDKPGSGAEKFAAAALPDDYKQALDGGWAPKMAKTALRDIALDAAGNVYVCDLAAGKVRKFDGAGKELAAMSVPGALRLVVSPKSGALYVVSSGKAGGTLARYAACEEGAKPQASLGFKCGYAMLAGDFSGEKPQLWMAPNIGETYTELLRIEDAGAELKIVEDLSKRDPLGLPIVDRLTVDPETDDLYVNNGWAKTYRFNGLTGKYNGAVKNGAPDPMNVTDVAISPAGHVFVQKGPSWSGPYERLTRDLKPAPFAETGTSVFGCVFARFGAGFCSKGSCATADGRLYSLSMLDWCVYYVMAYDAAGKAVEGPRGKGAVNEKQAPGVYKAGIRSAIVGQVLDRCGGLKVDRAGNVYVGIQVFPPDYKRPAGFEKDPAFGGMSGSVIKFKAAGGGMAAGKPGRELGDYEGVERVYPGLAPFSGWNNSSCCVCRSPRFELDGFGRLVIPNALSCDVRVVDNAGNEIATFGAYGNFDSQWVPEGAKDQKPLVASPEIPLAWPLCAGASEKKIYVGDLVNRRVVRVDRKFAAEEMCEVK